MYPISLVSQAIHRRPWRTCNNRRSAGDLKMHVTARNDGEYCCSNCCFTCGDIVKNDRHCLSSDNGRIVRKCVITRRLYYGSTLGVFTTNSFSGVYHGRVGQGPVPSQGCIGSRISGSEPNGSYACARSRRSVWPECVCHVAHKRSTLECSGIPTGREMKCGHYRARASYVLRYAHLQQGPASGSERPHGLPPS